MRQFTRSALVAAPPARLFALINDIERYPQFVPWCVGATVLSRSDTQVVATLDVKRSLLRTRFTTRNTLEDGSGVRMELVEGPFRTLTGRWTVTPIDAAGGAPLGCRVQLQMQFEFANALTASLLEPIFEQTVASLVEAFVARARRPEGSGDAA
jgi:ribosome-associated toxin RatA of RatAB toxin-antitoxin module